MGSFNSLSLNRKIRTSLAVPYNRLMRSTSWFFIWQLSRAGSRSVRNLPRGASQQVYQISGDEITTTLYLRQQERWDRNLKSQRASAVREQESSLQHPADVSALWSCASALSQTPAFPIRLVLRNSLILTSGGPHGASHGFYGAYTITPYQQPPHGKNSMSSLAEVWRGALHKLHCFLPSCITVSNHK